ncbi:MAG: nucleotidyltransferase family protein [Methanomicrobium sp.]|nr:nucleotidyltransferase family protein [Methanomicrobium sp.]
MQKDSGNNGQSAGNVNESGRAEERKAQLERIVKTLKENYAHLEKDYGIKELSIIGSYARCDQTDDSDLDIMVDFYEPLGWEVVDLRDELEKILGISVDLVLKAGVVQRKLVFDGILEDAVYVKA